MGLYLLEIFLSYATIFGSISDLTTRSFECQAVTMSAEELYLQLLVMHRLQELPILPLLFLLLPKQF